jgi:hypothetical protein
MESQLRAAWAAGLFDGEGSTCAHGRARIDGCRPGIRMVLSQKNTGPELLERFKHSVKAGIVKHREDRPGVWVWQCTNRPGCERALRIMWPYLSNPKRRQAFHLLRDWIPDEPA